MPSVHQNCAYLKEIKLVNDVNFFPVYSVIQINMALTVEQQLTLAPTITQAFARINIHLSNTTLSEKRHPFLPGSHQELKVYIHTYIYAHIYMYICMYP